MAEAEQVMIIKLTEEDVQKIKEGNKIRLNNDDGSNPDIVIYKEEK
jgi:uncharacterized UPF0146 family protein